MVTLLVIHSRALITLHHGFLSSASPHQGARLAFLALMGNLSRSGCLEAGRFRDKVPHVRRDLRYPVLPLCASRYRLLRDEHQNVMFKGCLCFGVVALNADFLETGLI